MRTARLPSRLDTENNIINPDGSIKVANLPPAIPGPRSTARAWQRTEQNSCLFVPYLAISWAILTRTGATRRIGLFHDHSKSEAIPCPWRNAFKTTCPGKEREVSHFKPCPANKIAFAGRSDCDKL